MASKLILFDLDDTLIHFADYWKPSLIETFRSHPSSRDFDSIQLFDVLWNHNKKYEQLYHNQEITLKQFRGYRFIDTLADFGREVDLSVASEFNDLHKEISKKYMKSDKTLTQLLDRLKSSYFLGIVTNGTTSWQHDKIKAMGIERFFTPESIIISEDVGYEKPSPEIYYKALSVFNIPPKETIFIGDSWINDVEGPGNVGIPSIWYNKKTEEVRNHQKLLGIVNNLEEITEIIT